VTELNRFSLIGMCAFGVELLLIFVFTSQFHLNYIPSVILSFIVGLTIHYSLSRQWVFHESLRTHFHGYTYFALIAGGGLLIALLAVSFLVNSFGMSPVNARLISALGSGLWNYLMNSHFNFRA
jgi:putative flippase GtrA